MCITFGPSLGVSRTSPREAIRNLVEKGLLDSRPKRGTIVREQFWWNHLDEDRPRWRIKITATATYLDKMFALRRAT
ncbi:GntR family transcriptional regulator [Paracoccus sp. JM45]|uniref:GntR family transcriptional regulator n=1 Tax=Paracoccus sp. JM45 TaxID=2283626 RepID=UPI0016030E23